MAEAGDFRSAQALSVELNKAAPDRAEPILLLARILQSREGPAQKADFLADCLARGKDDVRIKRELGQALLLLGEFMRARALAEEAISGGSSDATDYMILARSHFQENNLQSALEYGKEARRLAPGRAEPALFLARVLHFLDGAAQKAAFLAECIAEGLEDMQLKRELAHGLLASGDCARARTVARQMISTANANFTDHMIVAWSFAQENELQQAMEAAEMARQLAPNSPVPINFMAQIVQLRDGPVDKVAFLSECVSRGMDHFEVRRELFSSLSSIGDLESATEVAKSIDPEKCDSTQLFLLSGVLEMCDCAELAETCLQELDPRCAVGNAALLSDFLRGKLGAETMQKLKAIRNPPGDRFGKAIDSLAQAAINGDPVVDEVALQTRLDKLIADCHGAASYFATPDPEEMTQVPLVSIVAPIHRADDQDNLLAQLLRQDYPKLEAVIVINGPSIDAAAFADQLSQHENFKRVEILTLPEATSLPRILNTGFAATTGDFIARFDADDLYLDRYISRMIHFMQSMSADICGKKQLFIFLEALTAICMHGNRYEPIAHFDNMGWGGSSLIMSRAVMRKVQFVETLARGEDRDFFLRSWAQGFRIALAPPFDHLVVRRADKLEHTWKLGDLRFLQGTAVGGFLACCPKDEFERLLMASVRTSRAELSYQLERPGFAVR